MTDNEIIKALEWHSNDETHCSACPYEEHSVTHYCVDMVMKDALDLINRQKAEIERLKKGWKADVIETSNIKAEAVKGFAERLKEKTIDIPRYYFNYVTVVEYIDNLVKEMVGEG